MMCCRHLSCSVLLVVLATTLLVLAQDLGGGVNYPTYDTVPPGLSFTCQGRGPGYYADPEAQCQVWHWCLPNGQKYSFLCPNGTVFNQNVRVCDWYYNVDCASSPDRYSINDDLYKDQDGNLI
ncbi:U-scoloptoxin(01)-Er1a-like [Anabrus simplex]|uniref:U-scoloptoxin(01)-Er1a-like n=1 Tax=Anabrus simplex TaxID=316456 RepID=UPI0034DCF501